MKRLLTALGILFFMSAMIWFISADPPREAHRQKKPERKTAALPSRGESRTVEATATQTPQIAAQQEQPPKPSPTHTHPPKQAPAPNVTPAAPKLLDVPPDKIELVNRINNRLAGTPMAGLGDHFVHYGDTYGNDPRISVAIALVESGAGRAMPGQVNPYGMTCGCSPFKYACRMGFDLYADFTIAIRANNEYIARKVGHGVTSPYQLGFYAEDPAWESKVLGYMNEI